jgi:hypothetical protein
MMNPYSHFLFAAIGSVRSRRCRFDRCALQESQIEKRIDYHARAAGEDFALLKSEIFLVKIAEPFRLLRNERDVPEFAHGFTSTYLKSFIGPNEGPVKATFQP